MFTKTHPEGRGCEDTEGQDGHGRRVVSTSHSESGMDSKHQELEGAREDPLQSRPRVTGPGDPFGSDCGLRTVGESMSVAVSPPVGGTLVQQPQDAPTHLLPREAGGTERGRPTSREQGAHHGGPPESARPQPCLQLGSLGQVVSLPHQ